MNPTQQRQHTKVTAALEQAMVDALDGITMRLNRVDVALQEEQKQRRTQIGEERTHRLKLAEEQRAYVDRADRLLAGSNIGTLTALNEFRNQTFWQRLRWLVTGR